MKPDYVWLITAYLSKMLSAMRRLLKQFLMSGETRTQILRILPTSPANPIAIVRIPITRENCRNKMH